MKSLLKIINLSLLICLASYINAASADTITWPTYQGNNQRTAYVNITPDPIKFKERWKKNVPCGIDPPLQIYGVTSDSMLYYTSSCFKYDSSTNSGRNFWIVFAIDAKTGKTVWSKEFYNARYISEPTYVDGKIYLGIIEKKDVNVRSYGDLNVYDALTGTQLNTLSISVSSNYPYTWKKFIEPIITDKNIYYETNSELIRFHSVNKLTLKPDWQSDSVTQGDDIQTFRMLSFDQNGLAYYVGGTLNIIDQLTGQSKNMFTDQVISFGDDPDHRSAPVLDDQNQMAITSNSGMLTVYDLNKPAIKWTYNNFYNYNEGFFGQPAIHNNVLYSAWLGDTPEYQHYNVCLMALAEDIGKKLWTWCPDNPVSNRDIYTSVPSFFILTNSVIFISDATNTYAVDLKTHKTVWTYPESGNLSIDQNTLYIIPLAPNNPITAISLS